MAQQNLTNTPINFGSGMDSVILTGELQYKIGGVALDYSTFKGSFIRAGHIIIYKPDVADSHAPMPVTKDGGAYEALPGGYEYYGFAVSSQLKGKSGGICVRGNRNPKCIDAANGYYDITALLPALKLADMTRHFTYLADNF